MAKRLYRVRIEAYDPETEESEVILHENEDGFYSQLVFFGVDEKEALRSISMHVTPVDMAAMLDAEDLGRRAVDVLNMKNALFNPNCDPKKVIMDLLKGGSDSCLQ